MQSRLGVGLLSDLLLLTPNDVSKLGLKSIEERRLLLELERLRSGACFITTKIETRRADTREVCLRAFALAFELVFAMSCVCYL
jgi:hypothetical protein